jgi:2-oxoglutarate dehydrogenase E1 component
MKYRDLGHEIANVNPLGSQSDLKKELDNFKNLDDDVDYHDFKADELDTKIEYFSNIPGIHNNQSSWSPREAANLMSELYCGPISFEYMHIGDAKIKQWIRTQVEKKPQIDMTKSEKIYL